jgi:hypothetical protein
MVAKRPASELRAAKVRSAKVGEVRLGRLACILLDAYESYAGP